MDIDKFGNACDILTPNKEYLASIILTLAYQHNARIGVSTKENNAAGHISPKHAFRKLCNSQEF